MQAKGILLTDGSEKDKKVKNEEKEKSHNIKMSESRESNFILMKMLHCVVTSFL